MKRCIASIVCTGAIGLFAIPAGLAQSQRIIHHVSVGSVDAVYPVGADRNYTLVANIDRQGYVSGQWDDVFGGGGGKIHVAVDCLEIIEPGNIAIIGGVITHGNWYGVDVSGQRAVTMAVDNGTSANDPPDQISYSYFPQVWGPIGTCGEYTPWADYIPVYDITAGQVKVW